MYSEEDNSDHHDDDEEAENDFEEFKEGADVDDDFGDFDDGFQETNESEGSSPVQPVSSHLPPFVSQTTNTHPPFEFTYKTNRPLRSLS